MASVWSLYFAGVGFAANNGCVPIDAAESTWQSTPLVDMRPGALPLSLQFAFMNMACALVRLVAFNFPMKMMLPVKDNIISVFQGSKVNKQLNKV